MITIAQNRDMFRRRDEVMSALPEFLASNIPEGMKDWPATLILGLMAEVVEHVGPAKPEALSRYIASHMRVPFRPYGRRKLDALMALHLKELSP